MEHPLISRKKALKFTATLFILSLLALLITNSWWPGIMLAVGLPLALRQYLMGRTYDTMVSLLVFVGTFVTVQYQISWEIFLPVLFTLGAIYMLFKEFLDVQVETEAEHEEDLNHEIEENKKR